jgi:hypothetical protein
VASSWPFNINGKTTLLGFIITVYGSVLFKEAYKILAVSPAVRWPMALLFIDASDVSKMQQKNPAWRKIRLVVCVMKF